MRAPAPLRAPTPLLALLLLFAFEGQLGVHAAPPFVNPWETNGLGSILNPSFFNGLYHPTYTPAMSAQPFAPGVGWNTAIPGSGAAMPGGGAAIPASSGVDVDATDWVANPATTATAAATGTSSALSGAAPPGAAAEAAVNTATALGRACTIDRIADVACPAGSTHLTNETAATTARASVGPGCYRCPAGTFDHGHANGTDTACRSDDGAQCAACGAFDESLGRTGCAKQVATCKGICAPCGRMDCPVGHGAPDCDQPGLVSNACQLCPAGTFSPGGAVWFGDATTSLNVRRTRCVDQPSTGTDAADQVCSDYSVDPTRCGKHDTAAFNSSLLCCACGGGVSPGTRRDRFQSAWSCTACTVGISYSSAPGRATCSACHRCLDDTEEVAQACTPTSNTVCRCKAGFKGTPSDASRIHPTRACEPFVCTRPSAALYDWSRATESLQAPAFGVTGLKCAAGAHGVPVATVCAEDGPYSVAGCSACGHLATTTAGVAYKCPAGQRKTGTTCSGATPDDTQTCAACFSEPQTGGSGPMPDAGYRCPIGSHTSGSRCDGESADDTQTCEACTSGGAEGTYGCAADQWATGNICDGGDDDTQTCALCDACDGPGEYVLTSCSKFVNSKCGCVRGWRPDPNGGKCLQNKTYIELALGFLVLMVLYDVVFVAGTSSAGGAPHKAD